MEENKEYILFLRENDISEGKQYTIKFISFGKYNTSKEDNIVNQKSNIKYLEEFKIDTIELIKGHYEDSVDDDDIKLEVESEEDRKLIKNLIKGN